MSKSSERLNQAEGALRRDPESGRVMIVDDDRTSRDLIKGILESEGYDTIEAVDGKDALRQLSQEEIELPDVVVLDLLMPQLNGYETCRRIKRDSRTAHLPIIVVTGLTDRANRLQAIRDGANDYLTKPFDGAEVVLRVANAITSKRLYDRVAADVRRLRNLEEVRDNLVNMIVHDLNQPLTVVGACIQLMELRDTPEVRTRALSSLKASADRMARMVVSLLDVKKLEEGKMHLNFGPSDLAEVVRSVCDHFRVPSASKASIQIEGADSTIEAVCDGEIVGRVLSNLIDNAAKHAPESSAIRIALSTNSNEAVVTVTDSGPGIPVEKQEMIFEKFGQVSLFAEGRQASWGLGLTFCKMAVEAHDGTIGVRSEQAKGSEFWFRIPLHRNRERISIGQQ